jgi:uncharacterized protein
MKLKLCHTFKHNNGICLLNTEKMEAVDINENTAALLEFISKNQGCVVTPEDASVLEKLELIDKDEWKPSRKKMSPKAVPIASIALFVTQECNLRCIYCYGDGGSYGSGGYMTRGTAFRSVDWLIEQSEGKKKLAMAFFGGEPLLNFTLMKEVVQYALKRGNESGKEFDFRLTTNATLLDDEKIAFLKEHKINPLVSFDGPKELQDTQRPFQNGKGSYDAIMPKIKKLLEVLPESECRATIVGNTDPLAVDNFLHEIGFGATSLLVASRSLFDEEHDRCLSEGALPRMLNRAETEARDLREAIKARDTDKLKKLKRSGLRTGSLEAFVNGQKKLFPCGAGRASVAVSCSGDVYLCHRFVGSEDYKLGDIFSGDLKREIYQTSPLKFQNKCANCFAQYICAGGCYHDNLGKTGSIFEPNEDMCVLIRRSVELAAVICSQLNEDDKTYLDSEEIISKKQCPFDLF